MFRNSFRNSFCFKGGKCYVLSLVGSVFIVCFSFPCCTDLVCSVLEVELRPYTPAACLVGTFWALYMVEIAVVLLALPVPARVHHSHLYAL